jgi:hypothetical protein
LFCRVQYNCTAYCLLNAKSTARIDAPTTINFQQWGGLTVQLVESSLVLIVYCCTNNRTIEITMGLPGVKVIDGRDHLLGRLASIVAKELLAGQKIVIVRCDEIVISGSRK